ncbi:MAG: (deoxy)nucleoside triphosphate pyrophosphohydrolase [Lentisphaeria bacterium]|jgi:8-oxo-dGTP diphosphatase
MNRPEEVEAPLEVCAAVVRRQRRFLLATRPAGKHLAEHWEFPGGKVHAGETLEACIIRELREELGVTVQAPHWLATLDHAYPGKHIRLHFLAGDLPATAEPHPHEGQRLGWFTPAEMGALLLAPADRRFAERLARTPEWNGETAPAPTPPTAAPRP